VTRNGGPLAEAQRLLGSSRRTTPLDGLAAHVLRGAVEEILPRMVAA
jgi:hypothetical protein